MAAGRGGFGRSSGGGLGSGLVAVKVVVNSAQTILTEVGSFEPYPLSNLNLKAYVLGFFSSPAHLFSDLRETLVPRCYHGLSLLTRVTHAIDAF